MAPTPRQLSRQLRTDESDDLSRRRWLVGLSFIGTAAGMIVGLYQVGMLRRLPDLPFRPFDATKVDKSDYAYKRLQTPDAFLMVASYAVTAALAAAGGRDRARENPALPILLAAKVMYDLATALRLGVEEWRENKALCGYCQAATVASLVSVGIALPEAVKAVDHLLGSGAGDERGDERRSMPAGRTAQHPAERAETDADRPVVTGAYTLRDLRRDQHASI